MTTEPEAVDLRMWFVSGEWVGAPCGPEYPDETEPVMHSRTAEDAVIIADDHNALVAEVERLRSAPVIIELKALDRAVRRIKNTVDPCGDDTVQTRLDCINAIRELAEEVASGQVALAVDTVEAERDALQRQVDAVRALAEPRTAGERRFPERIPLRGINVGDVLAALAAAVSPLSSSVGGADVSGGQG